MYMLSKYQCLYLEIFILRIYLQGHVCLSVDFSLHKQTSIQSGRILTKIQEVQNKVNFNFMAKIIDDNFNKIKRVDCIAKY